MLDFHNHLIPGVDDGAADLAESRHSLATLAAQGVDAVITTPHVQGSLTRKPAQLATALSLIDERWNEFATLAQGEFPFLAVHRGTELMLDTPSPDGSDERLRLAATSFMLVEFPYMSIPPHSEGPLRILRRDGFTPVIAHPERYTNMATNMSLIESWVDAGAVIQVNTGSAIGRYGLRARKIAWQLLESGAAHYLASDYHARGQCTIEDCRAVFEERGATAQFHQLTVTNPERLLKSQRPLDVEPVQGLQLGFWQKVLNRA